MFSNYIKIAIRNILKRKGFTSINILGLTISLSVVILVGLLLQYHLTFDQHIPDSDRIYRLENNYRSQVYAPFRFENYNDSDEAIQLKTVDFLNTFSWIEDVAQIVPSNSDISNQRQYLIRVEKQEHVVSSVLFTNTPQGYFKLFPPIYLRGTEQSFVSSRQQVVLGRALAERFFGENWEDMNLIGQVISIRDDNLENNLFHISGVIEDAPATSHFEYDMIVSLPRLPAWAAYTYFKTTSKLDQQVITQDLNASFSNLEPDFGTDPLIGGVTVQEISSIHRSQKDLLYEIKEKVNPDVLILFGIVGFLVLIISWSNYANLTIAMYSKRQKEIGVRKVMGAHGNDIVFQLMMEILLISFLAVPVALLISSVACSRFGFLMNVKLPIEQIWQPEVLAPVMLLSIVSGLISGLYPSLVFSRRNLLSLFKSKLNNTSGKLGFGLRRTLLGIQFVLLITILSITTYIYQQMQFIVSRDLGFISENVLIVPSAGIEAHNQLKAELERFPYIQQVGTGQVPGTEQFNQTTYKLVGKEEVFDDAHVIYADLEAMTLLGTHHSSYEQLRNGKSTIFLINEAMAQKLAATYGMEPEDLIGMTILDEPDYVNPETGEAGLRRPIAGIIQDINYFSLKHLVNPMIFVVSKEMSWTYNSIIKFDENESLSEVISQVESVYYQAGNTEPFSFDMLGENVDQLYATERQTMRLITILSGIAIVLGIIGLVSLVSYMVHNRQREIGIRKVFGASASQILVLMNKEFIFLIALCVLISVPLVILVVNAWLNSFAYHITLNPLLMAVVGIVASFCVILVVTILTIQTAHKNPSLVLGEE